MRASVLFPTMPQRGEEVRPYADLVQRGAADRLWMGTSLRAETHQTFAFLAGAGYRVPVGTSVMLTPLRHPFEAAAAARSLALLTGHPVVAGFGASAPDLVAGLLGAPYHKPATAVREYLSQVRAFLTGTIPGLPAATRHPMVELGAGVLRPGMARAAGAVADVAITWMTPPAYIERVLVPALVEGAGAQRARPRIATVVHVALARPGRDGSRLAYLAAQGHLRAPHYVDMLRMAGLDIDANKPRAGARRLVEDGVFVIGQCEHIVETMHRYRQAGVDEVILNTAGVLLADGCDAATDEAQEILSALASSERG